MKIIKKINFIYILLLFFMFFGFINCVEAETFHCIYQFSIPSEYQDSKLKSQLSVMITQVNKKKPTYTFSYGGSTAPNAEDWIKNSNYDVQVEQTSYGVNKNTPYKECPAHAAFYKNPNKRNIMTIYFSSSGLTESQKKAYDDIISYDVTPAYNDSSSGTSGEVNIPKLIHVSDSDIDTCEKLFGTDEEDREKITSLLKNLVTIMRIIVPVIIIGMGIVDMVKGVFASDEQQMKKAQSTLMKRLIIGVAFFLIPSVLKLLLTIGSKVWPDIISSDFCGIL